MPPEEASGRLLIFFTLAALSLLLAAGVIVIYLAYDRQTARVSQLERMNVSIEQENEKIEQEHVLVGKKLAEISRDAENALKRARGAYIQGFRAGRGARPARVEFTALAKLARKGFLTPRILPGALRSRKPSIRRYRDGYRVAWPGRPEIRASTRRTLRSSARRAWPGGRKNVTIGKRRVTRLVGPAGIVYTWRERRRSYALLVFPESDRLARPLIAGMR